MSQSGNGKEITLLRRPHLALCAAMVLFIMGARAQAQSLLTHHTRKAVTSGQAKFLHRLPETQTLRIDIVLPVRDQAGLDKFLQDVYDPASPTYRQFLTVPEFTARFGPTQQDYDDLIGYAKSNGFEVVGGSRDAMDLQLEGSVTSIERAFNVSMGVYRHPTEDRTFYAPDREPMVYLPFPVWHISGLDNYSIPHPSLHKKTKETPDATTGSGPSASFLGSDMRAAYYGGTSLTGAGQNIGLLEFYGYDIADVNTYYTNAGQTRTATITGISTDGTSLNCTVANLCDDTEQTIDITQALGMAPGITTLYVYVGSSDTALLSAMSTDSPLPLQLSSSWGWTPADPSTDDPYFQKMAVQGQSFFQASGDGGAWRGSNYPSDDPNVICVGGTDLTTSSAGGPWKSETGWADSGGGFSNSDDLPIPSWQLLPGVITTANEGATYTRNGPDVSANSNFTYYVCADQTTCTANSYGGTSFAAPLWAGYMALANQQAKASSAAPPGFINPTIYPIGLSGNYATAFHDITSGSNGFPAVAGYDLVTGWGSPNGMGLINLLTGGAVPNFTASASPNSLTVAKGNSGSSTITTAVTGGFDAAITLTASGLPTGVTAGFGTNPIGAPGSGTSLLTLTVSSTATAGTYPITITGTSGSTVNTTTVSLTVTAPNFTISASPGSVSVARSSNGTSTISTAAVNGFNAAISLSASGLPSGVTAGFGTNPIPAPGNGNSLLTLTVGSSVTAGTYSITVTGTSGSTVNTTTVSLTVTAPNFTISPSPTSVSVVAGNGGTSTITTAAVNGFSSAITLSAPSLPTGVTAGFGTNPIPAPGNGSSTLTLTVGLNVAAGTYPITVTGTAGSTVNSTTVSLVVTAPNFNISASPASVSVPQGTAGASTITTSAANGFNSAVALSASGMPSGVTAGFNPTSIASPGNGSSTLTLTVGATAATGTYPITVSGTVGTTVKSTTVSLIVTAPNFTISGSPSTVSVVQGHNGTSTITTAAVNGFNSSISLSASGLPANVTAGFGTNPIGAPGNGSSTLTLTVGATAATGTYPITITGMGTGPSGTITHTTTVSLTVTAALVPNFTIAASPTSLTVKKGSSGMSTITTTLVNGFNSSVTLTASGMPTGVTATFSNNPIAAPGSGTSTLTLAVSSSAANKPSTITITGTGGGDTHTVTISLSIKK